MSPAYKNFSRGESKKSIISITDFFKRLFKNKKRVDSQINHDRTNLNEIIRKELHSKKNDILENYMVRQPTKTQVCDILQEYNAVYTLTSHITDFDTEGILDEYLIIGKYMNPDVFYDLESYSMVEELLREKHDWYNIIGRHRSEYTHLGMNFNLHNILVYQKQNLLMLTEVSFLMQHLDYELLKLADIIFGADYCLPYESITELQSLMISADRMQNSKNR
jgi:hypothetical protein